MALTHKQWHLMVVSIVAITLGLLLWFSIVFTTVTPLECTLPDEFWSRTDSALPSVIALYSTALFLLFILNAVIFYTGKKDASFKEALVTGSGAIANAFLIVTLGLILLTLVQSNHDLRVSYNEKIGVPYTSRNFCLQLEPFFGKWTITEKSESDSHFEDYILFSRDETISTKSSNLVIDYFSVDYLDKYYEPENIVRSIIPDSFKNKNTVKGVFEFYYCISQDKYCNWYHTTYYFEKFEEDLILIKIDLTHLSTGIKNEVDGQYILLNKITE